jgi:Na+/melibiose symporter-like transporter
MDREALPAPPARGLLAALRDHTFRSLRHRNYRLYFAGQIVSFTGSWVQNAALMWLIYDRTADPLWPPLLLAAQVGPTLVLGTWGGALADRLPKRRLIFTTQSAFLGTALVLVALVAADRAEPWLLFAVQVVNGVIQSVDLPTRLAFVPDLVPRPDLINAVSLNSLLFNSARAFGPALSGLMFLAAGAAVDAGWAPGARAVTLGALGCFVLNAASYAAVLAALRAIDVTGVGPARVEAGSLLDGFRYVLTRPRLAGLLLLTGVLCVFGWPALSLFPTYTDRALGRAETEYSLLVSSVGGGALLGALTTATFGTVGRRGFFLFAGSGVAAAALAGLAAAQTLTGATLSAGCLGFGLILFLSTGQSAVQLSVSDATRGRVMALWAMTLSASAPAGHLLAGAAATAWPVRGVLAGMAAGVGLTAAGALVLAVRGWRREGPASACPKL